VDADGNGWTSCAQGHQHWGRHGAAGLLLRWIGPDGPQVLLQQRSVWSHHGGTWGIPGGARDSHESPVQAALREADEEAGLDPAELRIRGNWVDDHGGWAYETVVADVPTRPRLWSDYESADLAWVPEDEVAERRLHPGFASTWPALRAPARRLVVDAANVVGSTPDGWWRDRAGATARLREQLAPLTASVRRDPRGGWLSVAEVVLVVEGAAATVAGTPDGQVRVVAAPAAGDDEIVRQAAAPAAPAEGVLVVTADRGLRARVTRAGVDVVGPRWLRQVVSTGQ